MFAVADVELLLLAREYGLAVVVTTSRLETTIAVSVAVAGVEAALIVATMPETASNKRMGLPILIVFTPDPVVN